MARSDDRNSSQRTAEKVRARTRPPVEDLRETRRKEIEEILQNAGKPSAEQLAMTLKATVTREDIASLPPPGDRQNPKLAHKLYYKTLGRLRRRFIRHNRATIVPETARRAINDEIRLFLKRGEKEADSRMAETKRMAEAVNIFVDWMEQHGEGEIAALYQSFCVANDEFKKKRS